MAMTSICPGCAHEEACGHAEAHECANRVPALWCSCDPLRRAEAERAAYRDKALMYACLAKDSWRHCSDACPYVIGAYCDAVLREVG